MVSDPFGEALESARIREGISMREVARRAGFTVAYLCDIRRGLRTPPRHTAEKIAAALNAPELVALAIEVCPRCKRPMEAANA